MSGDRYTITLTGRQVAELLGILAARQDMARRMQASEIGKIHEPRDYWQGQVKALEAMREAVGAGVTASAGAGHA